MNETGLGRAILNEPVRTSGEIESRLPFFAENVHRINEIACGLESICDRISGPAPPNACDSAKEPRPDSVIAQLDMTTSGTKSAMDSLDSVANRLRELI